MTGSDIEPECDAALIWVGGRPGEVAFANLTRPEDGDASVPQPLLRCLWCLEPLPRTEINGCGPVHQACIASWRRLMPEPGSEVDMHPGLAHRLRRRKADMAGKLTHGAEVRASCAKSAERSRRTSPVGLQTGRYELRL